MTRTPLLLLAVVLAGSLAAGCGSDSVGLDDTAVTPPFDLREMRTIIEQKNHQFTEAHVTGDGDTIDNMFTLDARVLPPNADPVVGRAAISQMTVEYLGYGITEFREETTDFYGNEQILIDQGNYVLVYGRDQTTERGKYLNVWKRENGEWKIYSNMWNTNAPASPEG
jgi:ketosteroid isomerase-like protein